MVYFQLYLSRYVQDCRLDLLFSGNAGTASLHLKHLQEDCLDKISSIEGDEENLVRKDIANIRPFSNNDARRGRGVSLLPIAETTTSSLVAISNIADSLCLNDRSGNGDCESGKQGVRKLHVPGKNVSDTK